jgi:hypothetical protein
MSQYWTMLTSQTYRPTVVLQAVQKTIAMMANAKTL